MSTPGMVYNGFDFGPYLRANPHRPILAPVTVTTDDVPGRDGTRFRSARLGELTIPVDVELRTRPRETVAELRHRLAGKLWCAEPAPLALPDDPHRYHLAVLDGESELDVLWETGETTLNFRCPDPVAYGMAGKAAIDTAASIRSGGNYETRPTITVVPDAGEGYKVAHAGSGEAVEVAFAFDGTKTLVIDCKAEHCEIDGANADAYVTLESDYFALEPGGNDLTATGGAGYVEWVERWL